MLIAWLIGRLQMEVSRDTFSCLWWNKSADAMTWNEEWNGRDSGLHGPKAYVVAQGQRWGTWALVESCDLPLQRLIRKQVDQCIVVGWIAMRRRRRLSRSRVFQLAWETGPQKSSRQRQTVRRNDSNPTGLLPMSNWETAPFGTSHRWADRQSKQSIVFFFFFLTGFRATTNESWSHQPTFPQSYWKLVTNASIAVQRGKRSLISRFLATLIGCSKMTDKKESGPIQSLPSLTRRSLMKDIGVHYGWWSIAMISWLWIDRLERKSES